MLKLCVQCLSEIAYTLEWVTIHLGLAASDKKTKITVM